MHVHRDDYGAKMGMWLFLFTELLLFGGMFILYMAYRVEYIQQFQLAAKELKVYMGGVNTIILLTSSLTMVLSIVALQRKNVKGSIFWLISTIAFALGFMVVKYFEWSEKISHGIYPKGPALMEKSQGEIIFFGLYYTMTGLHGLHVIIGVGLLTAMLIQLKRKKVRPDRFVPLENAGLYWHLVDLIWIFLFPLFYLLH
ncbi:MAG: cytochrome c oxidase subunit 3 family protein [Candidatus Kapabacteria bacterium]|nr:cytochrome c oxidase subunit 3 family protein [Ignavibacteriota bacterium]MCW5885316.1 cytochrome c oxidase subunit 3 family protein [Candidatus Kapabacteria bacterium]